MSMIKTPYLPHASPFRWAIHLLIRWDRILFSRMFHWKVVVIRFSPEVESNFLTNRNWGTCLLMSLVLLSCDKQPMPLPCQTFPTFASLTSSVKSHQRHTSTLNVDGQSDSTCLYEWRRDIRFPIATSRYITSSVSYIHSIIHFYVDLCVW